MEAFTRRRLNESKLCFENCTDGMDTQDPLCIELAEYKDTPALPESTLQLIKSIPIDADFPLSVLLQYVRYVSRNEGAHLIHHLAIENHHEFVLTLLVTLSISDFPDRPALNALTQKLLLAYRENKEAQGVINKLMFEASSNIKTFEPFSRKTTKLLNCKTEYIYQFRQLYKHDVKPKWSIFYAVTRANTPANILLVLADGTVFIIHLSRMDFNRSSRIEEVRDFLVKVVNNSSTIWVSQPNLSYTVAKYNLMLDSTFKMFQ
jgi:hypothetical protein